MLSVPNKIYHIAANSSLEVVPKARLRAGNFDRQRPFGPKAQGPPSAELTVGLATQTLGEAL